MNGIINTYKPPGETSFQTVSRVKNILNIKKCGHTGTLDPMAEGVLPICINQATKFSDYIMSSDKEYLVEMHFGHRTDTMDSTGSITESSSTGNIISKHDFQTLLKKYHGEINLKVPSYSAVKIKGKKAYELARKGLIKDAGVKNTVINKIEIVDFSFPKAVLRIDCGKGTYVRSLVDSTGEDSGCFAYMSALLRTRNGYFRIKDSHKPEDIKEKVKNNDFSFLLDINAVLKWPVAIIKDQFLEKVKNGNAPDKGDYLFLPVEENNKLFFIASENLSKVAVAKIGDAARVPLKPVKVFKNFL